VLGCVLRGAADGELYLRRVPADHVAVLWRRLARVQELPQGCGLDHLPDQLPAGAAAIAIAIAASAASTVTTAIAIAIAATP
jgi:hypothetical protein